MTQPRRARCAHGEHKPCTRITRSAPQHTSRDRMSSRYRGNMPHPARARYSDCTKPLPVQSIGRHQHPKTGTELPRHAAPVSRIRSQAYP